MTKHEITETHHTQLVDQSSELSRDFNTTQQHDPESRREFLRRTASLGVLSISGTWLVRNASGRVTANSPASGSPSAQGCAARPACNCSCPTIACPCACSCNNPDCTCTCNCETLCSCACTCSCAAPSDVAFVDQASDDAAINAANQLGPKTTAANEDTIFENHQEDNRLLTETHDINGTSTWNTNKTSDQNTNVATEPTRGSSYGWDARVFHQSTT